MSDNLLDRIPEHLQDKIPSEQIDRISKSQLLTSVVVEFAQLAQLLKQDVDECHRLGKENWENQFWRRSIYRAAFTWIEGTAYQMKQVAFKTHGLLGTEFSREEIVLLLEESYSLRDNGRVKERHDNYQRTAPNLRFAYAAMARGFGCDLELDVGGEGWQMFLEAIATRNRLTHPKSLADLNVTDEELAALAKVIIWFDEHVGALGQVCTASIQAKTVQSRQDNAQALNDLASNAMSTFLQIGALDKAIKQFDQVEAEGLDETASKEVQETKSILEGLKQNLIDSLRQ